MNYQKLTEEFNALIDSMDSTYESARDAIFTGRDDLKNFFDSQKTLLERLNVRGWAYPMVAPAGMPQDWIAALDTSALDSIVYSFYMRKEKYYFNKLIDVIKEDISQAKGLWIREAIDLFEKGFYTSCAMLLYAIIENSIFRLVSSEHSVGYHESNKPTALAKKAIATMIAELSGSPKSHQQASSTFFLSLISIPSLSKFVLINFGPVADFLNDTEPEMLNRHWLMHGMIKRDATAIECMKLFVGLNVVLHTFKEFFRFGSK